MKQLILAIFVLFLSYVALATETAVERLSLVSHGYLEITTNPNWLSRTRQVSDNHSAEIQFYANFGKFFNAVNWRPYKPQMLFKAVDAIISGKIKELIF